MLVFASAGSNPEKYLERDWVVSVRRIEHIGLGVDRDIGSKTKLPGTGLYQIPHRAECVRSNPICGMNRRFREKLVFVDQFEPRKTIISAPEIDSRFHEIAVQICSRLFFVFAPPHHR
jgi:hypothetical protein